MTYMQGALRYVAVIGMPSWPALIPKSLPRLPGLPPCSQGLESLLRTVPLSLPIC